MRGLVLLLLLITAVDLLYVDFAHPAACSSNSTDGDDDGDCLCCCAHVTLAVPPSIAPVQSFECVNPAELVRADAASRPSIYHPPRV